MYYDYRLYLDSIISLLTSIGSKLDTIISSLDSYSSFFDIIVYGLTIIVVCQLFRSFGQLYRGK